MVADASFCTASSAAYCASDAAASAAVRASFSVSSLRLNPEFSMWKRRCRSSAAACCSASCAAAAAAAAWAVADCWRALSVSL